MLLDDLERHHISYRIANCSNGWIETVIINAKTCFCKSVTFNAQKQQYFTGVDPDKRNEIGDHVLICGGLVEDLKDIFIIPWKVFFEAMALSKPINTYRDRDYLQYKIYLRKRQGDWIMKFGSGNDIELNCSQWRFSPKDAINHLANLKLDEY